MKITYIIVLAYICTSLNVHAVEDRKAEILQTISTNVDGRSFSLRLEKIYFGGGDVFDAVKAAKQRPSILLRQDITDAQINVAVDFASMGKYAILLTREDEVGVKGVLGAYRYVNRTGTIPSFGPYTAFFLHRKENILYWVVMPQLNRLREASIQVFRINPSCLMDISYENVVKSTDGSLSQNVRPVSEYLFRNIPGDVDFIPRWMWKGDVFFDYDAVVNAIKISLIDSGFEGIGGEDCCNGGVLTIFYDISCNAWRKEVSPSSPLRINRAKNGGRICDVEKDRGVGPTRSAAGNGREKAEERSKRNETSKVETAAGREQNKQDAKKDDAQSNISNLAESDKAAIEKLPLEEQAKKGAELYENPETREEGLAILRKSAKNGSPFALARLSALYYLGEGGVKKDYGTALRLMKSAAAKGFPSFLLPIAETEAALKREKERKLTKKTIGLGDGYAGRLEPYKVTPELRKRLDEFGLTAGWFRRDAIPEGVLNPNEEKRLLCNELPYLLFTPTKCGQKPVPMIVYFAGTGEQGTDLTAHFHQTTIFSIVTSPEFQKKHPCYLFAPMVPKEAQIACLKEWSPPMADLVCDAMYAVIRGAKTPKVDINRLYLTGLSYGGRAAWTFPFGYPGRFAASIPVAGYANAETVPDSNPGSFWFVYNEGEYASEKARRGLADMARVVAERGGEFRMSPIPDKGHNAWDKAWREDAVWDWMFSKSNNGSKGSKRPAPSGRRMAGRRTPLDLTGAVCKAAKPGRDEGTNPSRAADGLDATCYVSAEPVVRGDWWQIEFAQPVGGRITVKSGFRNGSDRAQAAYVEVSADGRKWTTAGRFKRTNGECTFVPRGAVKFLRVVSDSKKGETLVLREVAVE